MYLVNNITIPTINEYLHGFVMQLTAGYIINYSSYVAKKLLLAFNINSTVTSGFN